MNNERQLDSQQCAYRGDLPKDSRELLLSIVVPSRNRAKYATSMIASILDLKGNDFELIVSDNSDDDRLAEWVARRPGDHRLMYEHISGQLSMAENHNRAFSRAKGEFVCLIGDDDTVLPSILDACRWLRQQKLDALTPDTRIRYCWPDLVHRYWGRGQAGNIYIDPWKGRIWEGNPQREAIACMNRAGQGTGWLPKLYHGIVRRSLLEELRAETGAYCFSVSPDIYMAMALAPKVKRHACTDAPLTIPGSSGGSNSGRAANRQHRGDLRKDPHMAAFRDEVWQGGNPQFFSVQTVWAQAALEAARRALGREMRCGFNFPYLYAGCLLEHLEYFPEIRKAVSLEAAAHGKSEGSLWLSIALQFAKLSGNKSLYYAKRFIRPIPRGYSKEYGPYPDIHSASQSLTTILGDRRSWQSGIPL